MTKVISPSIRNSQNHPGLPSVPLISRMPAAKRAEIMRATWDLLDAIGVESYKSDLHSALTKRRLGEQKAPLSCKSMWRTGSHRE
jgi:hypothetical protein